jgi:hypothetical protein
MATITYDARLTVSRHFCIPDDQERFLPGRRRAPRHLPPDAPMPRVGEIVYLSSSSAWLVVSVIHEWRNLRELRVEIWLEHVGAARLRRPLGSELTQ